MLNAALINSLDGIQGRVVVIDSFYICKVKSGHSGRFENIQVRAVGKTPLDFVRQRISHRSGHCFGKLVNQILIVWAGLKHDDRAAVSSRVKIKDQADVPCPGMLIDESLRSEQPYLLAVAEKEDHVIA